jgi:hypothetical protein
VKLNKFLMVLDSFSPAFLPIMLICLLLLTLLGCKSTPVNPAFDPTPVQVVVKVPYRCGQPPPVDVVIMRDIDWDIITLEDVDLFTLTVDDYKFLGLNTSDWIAASAQMKEQRTFYRDCIMRSQKEIQDENLDAGLVPSPAP